MLAGVGPVRIGIVTALFVAFGYLWLLSGRGVWYDRLSERFIFGVPWGTVLCIAGVVGFYLSAQSGFTHWNSPVTLPFRSWSYLYPLGLLTSGFAHAGPGHLMGNMIGTLVLAPIVEYAWGHYPPQDSNDEYEYPPPAEIDGPRDSSPGTVSRWHTPWVRALVIFPAIVAVVSLVTSVLAFGWSLGFSGTVYAFGGFAVVYFPVAAVIAMVGFTGTAVLVNTLLDPVVRATAEAGSGGPPSWWGVNVQAHLLGFLLGVLLALVLLHRRNESRRPALVFFATLLFGLSRQLYVFADSPEEDVFLQLRGVGVIFVLGLSVLVTAAVAADESPLPDRVSEISWVPRMRLVSVLWIGSVAVLIWAAWSGTFSRGSVPPFGIGTIPVLLILLLYPFFPSHRPSRIGTQLTRRDLFVFSLAFVVAVVALPSIVTNNARMAEDPVPDGESITVDGYEVTYAEGTRHGRIGTEESGLIVVNEQRQIWIAAAGKSDLKNSGTVTVPVGGIGWRETVTATRRGWNVVGNDSAYTVEVSHGDETVQAFRSGRSTARAEIANKTVAVEPGDGQFRLNVTRGDTVLGTTAIPAVNDSARVGSLSFETERTDGTPSVFAREDGTRVLIAKQERGG
ncbi:rhomboid family intramembrane serine protease [Halovenus sp. WSH3]|uniref:Rhomboid family intramembrane serine protease n=1 Tax=Halovenus carboxidivorans TaxID=2692199 RepID=A0A6B0TAS2_9EURY|nr:rhomboid family intramembrane serine protease [Halovenus carboxidivorans]MXR52502.1 rhomboid family intramembrane serine protease [Halovenus carboxidivorans]